MSGKFIDDEERKEKQMAEAGHGRQDKWQATDISLVSAFMSGCSSRLMLCCEIFDQLLSGSAGLKVWSLEAYIWCLTDGKHHRHADQ